MCLGKATPSRAKIGTLVSTAGYDIHVREDGQEDAPPIVLLHGFLGSMHWYDRLTPFLSKHFRVMRTDLLGHGCSSKPARGYDAENQARVLGELLDRIGVTDAIILGHSMGADIAISLTEQGFRTGRLIIINEAPDYTVFNPPAVNSLLLRRRLGPMLWQNLPAFAIRAAVAPCFAPGYPLAAAFDVPDRPVQDARAVPYRCFRDSQAEQRRFFSETASDIRLSALRLSTLVIFGEKDQIFGSAESCDRYRKVRNVKVETISDAGHSPMLENPSQTAEIISTFLAGA
jgi:pimeloyl-ACP methyl ester carboxylesterase